MVLLGSGESFKKMKPTGKSSVYCGYALKEIRGTNCLNLSLLFSGHEASEWFFSATHFHLSVLP
jgi:hypothetical protein